ncbi:uncharacterized protein [Fopius arisanus]|uniref:Uncharacterized protein n=1 Tax=Fopius arisanus TaxID=64838 RepID=A0A9R1SXE9_9HYME|nr:PREDICTED: uncharacterized protein LOC105264032 [Fopius arisanus]
MIISFIILGFLGINSANGLICYYCTAASAYDSCILDNGVASGCDMTYCTIFRRELIDPPHTLVQFQRTCQETPQYINVEVNDSTHRTFYHACATDLCNTGEGRLQPNSIKPIKVEPGKVLMVPGIGSMASSDFPSYILVPSLLLVNLSAR